MVLRNFNCEVVFKPSHIQRAEPFHQRAEGIRDLPLEVKVVSWTFRVLIIYFADEQVEDLIEGVGLIGDDVPPKDLGKAIEQSTPGVAVKLPQVIFLEVSFLGIVNCRRFMEESVLNKALVP